MNWLDWVLLTVLLLSALNGFTRGLLRSVAGLAAVAFGFWLALRYYRLLGDYLDSGLGLGPVLTRYFTGCLGGAAGTPVAAPPSPGAFDALERLFVGGAQGLFQGVASSLAVSALDALAFLIVFIAGAGLLGAFAGAIPNLPLLGPLDRAGGFCFGLLRGFLLGALVYALVRFLAAPEVSYEGRALNDVLQRSFLGPSYEAALNYLWALISSARG
ncbi:MAG: CvpA family protein [Thermoanaerobacterales bacterium]|nr:CvpA family protein [Bacillota bacterium]MDI6907736.1 CvpA family protein [Thermoanaerobacterales bacterium]